MKLIFTFILVLSSFSIFANTCQTKDVQLQVLGSGGPELDDGRNSSGYIIWYKNKARLLVDTGPGTSTSFSKTGAKFEDIHSILFTHFHTDHSADFVALIKGSFFTNRTEVLNIYGPAANKVMPSTSEYLSRVIGDSGAFPYLNGYIVKKGRAKYKVVATDIPLEKSKVFNYTINDNIKLAATTVHHGKIAAVALRIEVGQCSIVFSGDMTNRYNILKTLAKDADLLVANNAIPEKTSKRAKGLHMPPSEIGKIAKEAKVKKVLLSHFMKRTLSTQKETIEIIKTSYKGPIQLATDGLIIQL